MNKQEKNIVDILTFDEIEDVVGIFINQVYHTDETVALITNRELVKYAMDELLDDSFISVKRVDFELEDEDTEYMISVDDDGCMVVQPVEYYDDKYFMEIEYAFVDMDGRVSQMTIDKLLDRNVPVVLFGLDDDEYDCANCDLDECLCCSESEHQKPSDKHISYSNDKDGNLHGFSATRTDGNSYFWYSFYSSDKMDINDIHSILNKMGF